MRSARSARRRWRRCSPRRLRTDGGTDGGRRRSRAGARRVDEDAIEFLAARSEGDARTALNALELAATTAGELGEPRVTLERARTRLQRRAVLYDKRGDRHYDYISAWIKATRGSDPDASLYYLAVMLEGGEDPRFIVRRMVILASEDIGNADPGALSVATAAAARGRARRAAGGTLRARAGGHLSRAGAEVERRRARARGGRAHVREHGAAPVPGWLRPGARPGQQTGGYDYPHERPGHLSPQELLPEGVAGERFYEPDEAEASWRARLERIRRARGVEQR